MKKVISVSLARTSFNLEEDAYDKLRSYLSRFEQAIADENLVREVMEDVEARIAEIFSEHIQSSNRVVGLDLVDKVIALLGTPDSQAEAEDNDSVRAHKAALHTKPRKRLYRNPEDQVLTGVCGGLAAYFNIDPVLVRIVFACLAFTGMGIFLYIVLWLVTPKADTVAKKLEMRGEPVTAENIRNYTSR